MQKSIVAEKSIEFALRLIELYKLLVAARKYVISKQLVRSGTSIGANISEALAAESRADFIHKMSIASKEARETKFWLSLLERSNFVAFDYTTLSSDAHELASMLSAIVKTSKLKRAS
jgi:four helix bundle protein